jgi:hypothetical protein
MDVAKGHTWVAEKTLTNPFPERRHDMPKESFDRTLALWEKLLAAAEASSDTPFMDSLHRELGGEVRSFRALLDRRSELKVEMRRSTREVRSCRSRAGELASRIQSLARAAIVDSEHLREFGVKPRSSTGCGIDRKEGRTRPPEIPPPGKR